MTYIRISFYINSITNCYAREYGAVIFTFINAKININQRVKNEVEQEQRQHRLPVN